MTIYLLPIILTGLAYATSLWRIASIDRTVLLFSTVVAALFAGLRWNSDVDYLGYLEIYTDTPNLSDFRAETIYDLYGEPAYLLLNSILKSVGVEFYFVTMICAFSSLALKSYVSAKMSKRASLGICLYLCIHFLTIEFIQIRWAVASSLLILAFYFQFRRNLILTVACHALAIGFHYFSLVFVLIALLMDIRSERRFYVCLFIMALAGVAIDSDLFLLPALVDSDLYVIKRAVRYLDEPSSQVGLFSYLRLLLYIGLFALAKCLERGTNVKELALDRFLRRVSHGSLALTLLVSFVPLMHFRAVVLADFFSILFVLNVLDRNLRFSFDRVAVATLCGLFSLWYYFDLANYVSADRIYTYQTWFGQLK